MQHGKVIHRRARILGAAVPIFLALMAAVWAAHAQSPSPTPSLPPELGSLDPKTVYRLPSAFVTNIEIAKTDPDGTVTGTFTVENHEKTVLTDLRHQIQVLGPIPPPKPGEISVDSAPEYDRVVSKESVSVLPGQSKQVPFRYQAPRLPEGNYRLRIRIITSQGRELGWEDATVRLGTPGVSFVLLQPGPVVLPDGTTGHPDEGINVNPGTGLKLRGQGENLSRSPLTVIPHLELYQWDLTGKKLREQNFDALTIAPRQTANVEVPVTVETSPDAYHAVLTLRDQQGNRVSSQATYRYVVKGVSGKVVTARFKELATAKGAVAVIAADLVGPADRLTQVETRATVELLDGDSAVAEQTIPATLDLNVKTVEATFILPRDIGAPGFRITLRDPDGAILDHYVSTANLSPEELRTAATTPPSAQILPSSVPLFVRVLVAVIALVVLVFLLVYLVRKRRSPTSTIMLVLLLAGGIAVFLRSPPAEANGIRVAFYNRRGGTESTLFVNRPLHGGTYGPIVPTQFELRLTACRNGVVLRESWIRYDASGEHSGNPNLPQPVQVGYFPGQEEALCGTYLCPVVRTISGPDISFATFSHPRTTVQFHTNYSWGGVFEHFEVWNVWINFLPNAACVSIASPDRIHTAQSFRVIDRKQNTGNVPWTSGGPNPFRLGLESGVWGPPGGRAELPQSPVNRDGTAVFDFIAQAPPTPGSYTSVLRMLQENVRWFGTACNRTVTVVPPGASCQWTTPPPTTATPGQQFTATLRMTNTGQADWTGDDPVHPFRLGRFSGNWGPGRMDLSPTRVIPGGVANFTFTASAPSTTGSHAATFNLLQEGFRWFPTPGCSAAIQVQPPSSPPVTCAPPSQTVAVGTPASFQASGGTGSFSWSAPSGTPPTGAGTNFSTRYATAGPRTVTLTSGSSTNTCTVQVVTSPQPLTCAPTTQSAQTGQDRTVTATGGTGSYAWSTPGATRSCPPGSSCTTSYAAAGTRTVTVTSGSQTASCTIVVQPPGSSRFTLTVTRAGSGSGTVTSTPAGIACGTDCTELYDTGTTVSLTPAPAAGSTFGGWSGDCNSNGQVTMTADRSCTATFNTGQPPPPFSFPFGLFRERQP